MLNELIDHGYTVETEVEFDVIFKNKIVGLFRVDLIVNHKIILELKAISREMPAIFQAQVISYLKASGLEIGLLLNFGNPVIQVKRFGNYKDYKKKKINQI